MSRVGVLTGLAAEARIVDIAGSRLEVACCGADSEAARRAVARLVASGARSLVSFGIAGALTPGLASGSLVIAERVLFPSGETRASDAAWRAAVANAAARRGLAIHDGPLAGRDAVVALAAEKRALHAASGAVAVDMESHVVAAAAAAAGLPFLALRAVADRALADLPGVALVGYAGGRVRPWRAARALAAAPGETPEVVRLALATALALGALRRLVRAVGPDLLAPR